MIKKIWNFITTAALVIMLMLVAILYIPKFLGISPLIVLSGSMEPVYPTGSLLYVNQHNLDNIQIGDAITFYIDENTLATHRVVEIDEISCTYITKGDANEVNDGSPVSFDDVLGVPIINIPNIEVENKITYKGEDNENGPSGGLMFTLSIYNAITEYDITNGYKISGTGTINMDGTIGIIGGVKYKLAGAVKKNADIFIAPSENYEEALELQKKNKYDIKIIKADTFEEALEELKKLK